MAGVGSYLPVAFLLLWLPKGYWNFTLSVTWFWQVWFFYSQGNVVRLEVPYCADPVPKCL